MGVICSYHQETRSAVLRVIQSQDQAGQGAGKGDYGEDAASLSASGARHRYDPGEDALQSGARDQDQSEFELVAETIRLTCDQEIAGRIVANTASILPYIHQACSTHFQSGCS